MAISVINQVRFQDIRSILMKVMENPNKSVTDTSWNGIHHNLQVSKRLNHISLMEGLTPESTAYHPFIELKKVKVAEPDTLKTLVFQTPWLVL